MLHETLSKMILIACLSLVSTTEAEAQRAERTNLTSLHSVFFQDVIDAAKQLDAERYDFRPTTEVRSFGGLLGHIAGSSYAICALARDVDSPEHGRGLEEKAGELGKKGLLKALEASRDYCEDALSAARAPRSERATRAFSQGLFDGKPVTTGDALAFHVSHLADHYGNIAIYLRILGEVPPSTQRAQRAADGAT